MSVTFDSKAFDPLLGPLQKVETNTFDTKEAIGLLSRKVDKLAVSITAAGGMREAQN